MNTPFFDLLETALSPYSVTGTAVPMRNTYDDLFLTGVKTAHTDNQYVFLFQLAGVSDPNSVDIECSPKLLKVNAETEHFKHQYTTTLHRDTDLDSANVTLEHGMLTVSFNRREPVNGVRKLRISSTPPRPMLGDHEVVVADCDSEDDQ
jgi:HSP20 family molecular chaperone IbpA